MLELFDVCYEELHATYSDELYTLRKKTFNDRLGWKVRCINDMESDEFDGPGTRYILGVCKGQLVCSVRFTSLHRPNMITHTFSKYFIDVPLPSLGTESSRFFVDKVRAQTLMGKNYPISHALFLAMINWARIHSYNEIFTIVSRGMLTILRRSGWEFRVLKESFLSVNEKIYLLSLPTGQKDYNHMSERILSKDICLGLNSFSLPLRLSAL